MKIIEHRRHSMRSKPFPHLNQQGVHRAHQVGKTLSNFHYVVTSTLPRAAETAVAFGFGIDETFEQLSHIPDAILEEVAWDAGFEAFFIAMHKKSLLYSYANSLRDLILKILEKVPSDGKLLVVSHGGIVEACLLGCVLDKDIAKFGPQLDYCEGVRMSFENGNFFSPEILRL